MPAPAYYAHLAAFHARVHVTNGKYEAFQVFCDIRPLSNCARTKKVSFFILKKKKKVEGNFVLAISKWLIFPHLYVKRTTDFCTHDFLGTCLFC